MATLETLLENLVVWGGAITALSYVPQMWRMYRTKRARDLSLVTYGLWAVIPSVTLVYVYLRQDWYLIAGLGLAWLAALLAFIQALYYRNFRKGSRKRRGAGPRLITKWAQSLSQFL